MFVNGVMIFLMVYLMDRIKIRFLYLVVMGIFLLGFIVVVLVLNFGVLMLVCVI